MIKKCSSSTKKTMQQLAKYNNLAKCNIDALGNPCLTSLPFNSIALQDIPDVNYMFKVNNKTLEQGVKYVQS